MLNNNGLESLLSVQKIIGKGYNRGWFTNFKGRYRCFKGARNTKKSYVIIGIEVLIKIMSNPQRNILIIRQIGGNNRLSTFATLCMLIHQPDPLNNPEVSLDKYFKIDKSTMIITYIPTGQQIIFAGMFPDSTRITSIRVPRGFLTDVYIEEAFELPSYEMWRKVDGSFRGKLPDNLFIQITFCFNAWNKSHWLYDTFFKGRLEDDAELLINNDYIDYRDNDFIGDYGIGLYLHISTYKINEFRDIKTYDLVMEEMRKKAPEIYKVEALGMWGNAGSSTYPEFNKDLIITRQQVLSMRYAYYTIGIDTGLSDGDGKIKKNEEGVIRLRSATTMQMIGLTNDFEKVVCVDEFFYSNEQETIKKTEPELQTDIINALKKWRIYYNGHPDLMKGVLLVYVDCADKGFRQGLELEARKQGLFNVQFIGSAKDVRIRDRVQFLRRIMAYGEYLVCDSCKNLIREIQNSREGTNGKARDDIDDHAINANEYAWIPIKNRIIRWKDFKKMSEY